MKTLVTAVAIAAIAGTGAVAQACPGHKHHSKSHHSYKVKRAPDRYYTGSYDYSPGYNYYYSNPGYYNNYGYAPGYWNSGSYYNSYNTVGVGLGPLSIGF
jgi:hypothetical protein